MPHATLGRTLVIVAIAMIALTGLCPGDAHSGVPDPCTTFLATEVGPAAPGSPVLVWSSALTALVETYDLHPPDRPAPPPKA